MVERLRMSAGMSELVDRPWILEWVIRIFDGDESLLAACYREFYQEAGSVPTDFPDHLQTYYPNLGRTNEPFHLFYQPVMRLLSRVFEVERISAKILTFTLFQLRQLSKRCKLLNNVMR